MRQHSRRFAVIVSAALLAGCAMNITRLYTGQHSLEELSVIIWDPSVKPRIEQLDGTPLPQGLMRVQRAEFLPGQHTFTIHMPDGNPTGRFVTIRRETLPGRCYRLERQVMSVTVASSGQVVGSDVAPVLSDTAVAACPTR